MGLVVLKMKRCASVVMKEKYSRITESTASIRYPAVVRAEMNNNYFLILAFASIFISCRPKSRLRGMFGCFNVEISIHKI